MQIKIDTFDSESINDGIKQLRKFKKQLKNINRRFIISSLEWIRDRANAYLIESVKNFPESANVSRGWEIQSVESEFNGEIAYRLINTNNLATFVEFGTGVVGLNSQHPKSDDTNYVYDKNGHGWQGWNFRFNYNGKWYIYDNFTGYEGKSFLYDAYYDYFYRKEYVKIYNKIMEKYINRVYKGVKK